jgi:hypothetical protein
MRYLDALYAHVQEAEDEGRIEARRAHDRGDPNALGCHHRKLHVVQVEAGVLHVDESRVETGKPDQLDDLRVSDPADMGPQSEAAFAQDALHAILFHVVLPASFAAGARPLARTADAAGRR